MNFVAFCNKHNITHIHKRTMPIYLSRADDAFYLSKEMLEIVNAQLSGTKNAILDIHLLGGEARASIAFCTDNWRYGFSIGHKFAVPNKSIKISNREDDLSAVDIIAKEMRDFAFNHIKRKPYKIFKPSVLKAIRL